MSINQEEKDREAWFTIILFILYAQRKDELLDVWDKFEEEILYNNRFFIFFGISDFVFLKHKAQTEKE